MLVLAMGLGGGQSPLLMALLLLLTCLQMGMSLERISYVPQLSSATLAGRLTQSTFTLEQPRGQFSHPSISDSDAIWLVVAHSNATQKFMAPQKVENTPVPANFPQGGYYLTLRASRALYPGGQPSNQLRVLRVGNDTCCSPRTRGCNCPLPGPGPYRVKFLVMSDRGPMAETEWSNETRLQQAEVLQAAPGPQTAGTVVIIAILSILLAILLAALLTLLIFTWYNTCGSTPISGPGELVFMRKYDTHHMSRPSAVGAPEGLQGDSWCRLQAGAHPAASEPEERVFLTNGKGRISLAQSLGLSLSGINVPNSPLRGWVMIHLCGLPACLSQPLSGGHSIRAEPRVLGQPSQPGSEDESSDPVRSRPSPSLLSVASPPGWRT